MFHWLYHALAWTWGGDGTGGANGDGYLIFSGPFGSLAIFAGVAVWVRRHNCHTRGCWRLAWHPDPEHGHPVCRRHHPDHPSGANSDP